MLVIYGSRFRSDPGNDLSTNGSPYIDAGFNVKAFLRKCSDKGPFPIGILYTVGHIIVFFDTVPGAIPFS
jgi:hypothetical protein